MNCFMAIFVFGPECDAGFSASNMISSYYLHVHHLCFDEVLHYGSGGVVAE